MELGFCFLNYFCMLMAASSPWIWLWLMIIHATAALWRASWAVANREPGQTGAVTFRIPCYLSALFSFFFLIAYKNPTKVTNSSGYS